MKKLLVAILACLLILSACSNKGDNKQVDTSKGTKNYKLENGKTIKVPKNPKK